MGDWSAFQLIWPGVWPVTRWTKFWLWPMLVWPGTALKFGQPWETGGEASSIEWWRWRDKLSSWKGIVGNSVLDAYRSDHSLGATHKWREEISPQYFPLPRHVFPACMCKAPSAWQQNLHISLSWIWFTPLRPCHWDSVHATGKVPLSKFTRLRQHGRNLPLTITTHWHCKGTHPADA